jgi:hypothetical protein
LVSGRLRDSTAVGRRRSNIRSSICARVGIVIDAIASLLFPKIMQLQSFEFKKSRSQEVGVQASPLLEFLAS